MQFFGENTKYPEFAKNNDIQGRIFVGFVIDKDGSIIDVEILRSVQEDLDEEAIRVVSSMPNWTPGQVDGRYVRVKYQVPFNFKLYDKEKKPKKKKRRRKK